MTMRKLFALMAVSMLAVGSGGCGGDDERLPVDHDAEVEPPMPDAGGGGTPDGGGTNLVARGDYLVNHLIACVDCHTPRLKDGSLDPARHLAGVECFIDID